MTATSRNDGISSPAPDETIEPGDAGDALPKRELQTLLGGCCRDCGVRYSAREAVFTIFLGLKNAPRCLPCTSKRLERPLDELWAELLACIRRRDCYLQAWREAERIDGVAGSAISCSTSLPRTEAAPATAGNELPAAADWDAGDMACGELVMQLRIRMAQRSAGEILRVTAHDPAAPEDLPAWCRLCGHTLVAMNHPYYWIRRKGD
jgi:tRNA 2-thiouridine synthesizing protein A